MSDLVRTGISVSLESFLLRLYLSSCTVLSTDQIDWLSFVILTCICSYFLELVRRHRQDTRRSMCRLLPRSRVSYHLESCQQYRPDRCGSSQKEGSVQPEEGLWCYHLGCVPCEHLRRCVDGN